MEISKALEPMGIPVCHPPYSGSEDTFVTYQLMGQMGTVFAEGQEAETGVTFSVDLYTTGEYEQLVQEIKNLTAAAGYICVVDQEMYESDTKRRHIAMTATIPEKIYG